MKEDISVELLHLPTYRQGDHDGLCVMYSCSILLGCLFPHYRTDFGHGARRRGRPTGRMDPLVRAARTGRARPGFIVGRWFYDGQYVFEACELLNRLMVLDGHSTRFLYREGNRSDRTFEKIAASIDRGLPVVLGYETGDFGTHCVVISGYQRGQLRWFHLVDPAGDETLGWEALRATMRSEVMLILVDDKTHGGARPDKSMLRGEVVSVERWSREGPIPGYVTVEEAHR